MTPVDKCLTLAAMYADLTFRGLLDVVSRQGLEIDDRPRDIVHLVKTWGVSRTYLYNIISGDKAPSEGMVKRITAGMQQIAPWVTEEIVKAAVARTQTVVSMKS